MDSETEKYHRRRNRDLRWGRIIGFVLFLPVIIALGMCTGAMIETMP